MTPSLRLPKARIRHRETGERAPDSIGSPRVAGQALAEWSVGGVPRFDVAEPVLVGVDFSDSSRHSLAWAAMVTHLLGQETAVLHAFSPWAGIGMSIPPFDYDEYREALTSAMADWVRPLDGAECIERIVEEEAADGLLEERENIGAGMIVVGAHGHGDRVPRILGSVTQKLLHVSPAPVCVVPQSARIEPPAGRIVVGVDGSAPSVHALNWGATWAKALNLGIYAVCVFPMSSYSEKPRLAEAESVDPIGETLGTLRDLAKRVSEDAAVKGTSDVVVGHPAQKLIEVSRDEFALVVGKTGQGGFAEVLFGSTSRNCATHAGVPVVVVP